MGIQGLSALLHERAPQSMKDTQMKDLHGRKIAIDASMYIYQFMIAMQGLAENGAADLAQLQNADGEVTTHLNGIWSRTLKMIDEGLKPIYVFDGKPPEMKRRELDKRRNRATDAKTQMENAKEEGDGEAMLSFAKRTVRVTRDQIEECKKLLSLMGLPIVQATSEAEAQCVELVKKDKCYGVATEDMDALAFGATVLIRNLSSTDKKRPSQIYRYEHVLQQLGFTRGMFIDLCILMGCDYLPKIPGVGPVKAFEGISKEKSMEKFLETLDKTKHPVPADFDYVSARKLFVEPDVIPGEQVELNFKEPDADALIQYMVKEKGFNEDRIVKGIAKLREALQRKVQMRLDQFFTVKASTVGLHATQLPKEAGKRRAASAQGAGAKPANGAATDSKAKAGAHKKAVSKN